MRTSVMALLVSALVLTTTGCKTTDGRPVRDRPEIVEVPVFQPCAKPRPKRPVPLKGQTPDWSNMDLYQAGSATAAWVIDWIKYGMELDAATAACPEVPASDATGSPEG